MGITQAVKRAIGAMGKKKDRRVEIRVPSGIKRKLLGSKRFKRQRDGKEK